ncbi:hypothetical protein BEL04_14170 [Mucilaginibacter sp. PPCGB 2223]|uniref:hypothetical protein n=1 Tax=Mucilaginibacter sp. PPCGB 2223 TaxID=1886027 RepID=UPI000824AB91|nr:hypothetical protein [Mucilaginibacter sp. PPCGB 2223]OCX52592.1 hypothetical protein BEL04_14170 [Mucilaginibacter sp. PPCGB 2223]
MQTRKAKTILTTIVLLMSVIETPLFYYYTYGFFTFILFVPYGLTGLILSIVLLKSILKYKSTNTAYHICGLIISVVVGTPSAFKENKMEYLDWKLRIDERQQIVNDIKNGVLKPNADGKFILTGDYLLPIGDINVSHDKDGFIEVEFITDAGFIDHYSALVYTERKIKVRSAFSNVTSDMDEHWYTIHY